jgi:hypothetical protein
MLAQRNVIPGANYQATIALVERHGGDDTESMGVEHSVPSTQIALIH